MKRFFFSLEKLLDLRSFREKETELALGKAVSYRDGLQLELDEVARKRVSSGRDRRGALPIADLLAIDRYIARLDNERDVLLEKIAEAELLVEKARADYIKANRERQVLSKLKEKKTAQWKKESLQDEAEVLDDIVNFKSRDV